MMDNFKNKLKNNFRINPGSLFVGLILFMECLCFGSGFFSGTDAGFRITASAESDSVYLYDESGKLNPEENQFCMDSLETASQLTGMNLVVILGTDELSESSIESLAKSTYELLFPGTWNSDGLCYYMDLRGHSPAYDYISTCGMAQFYYTNAKNNDRVDAILRSLDAYLVPAGSEDITGAVAKFCEQLEYYYNAGIPERYYVYDSQEHQYYHVEDHQIIATSTKPYLPWDRALLLGMIGLITGIVVAAIVFSTVKIRYQFKTSLTPTNYANKRAVHYKQQYDRFIRERTTKTKIESSSGSSHHSGGGHSSGGHSSGGHGGGGHHR
ncbi:MAG: TPM domain-containing protein [Oscillospiraceae bacterium]|nr:TPM domain-containing protein [Oscillospiraceae bacterium]